MSIQNKRIGYLTDIILQRNLQDGLLPDSKEFVWQLNMALQDLNNDKSSFSFKPYRNTQVLTSNKLNEDNNQIYEDLFVLYDNNKHINNLLNREYQYFLTKKKKIEKELDIEENRLRQYVQNNGRAGFLPYAYDTFDTTDKVNLEETSQVFIDTNNNGAHIVEEKNTSRRIYPAADLTFRLLPDKLDLKELNIEGGIENILKDTEDTVWQKQILLKENLEITGTLEVNFDRTHLLNYIQIRLLTVKPVPLIVYFTPDNETWYNLPYHEEPIAVEKEIALDFPEMDVKALRFVMTKPEYDEALPEPENYNYQYLFGFEKIAFYNKSYPTEGTLTSKELTLQNRPDNYVVDTVQLYTDDWVPTETDIEYEVALPGEVLDWQPISPMNQKHPRFPQKVFFHNLRRNVQNELYFPEELSIRQSEAEDLLKNGIPLYKLTYDFGNQQQFYLPSTQILEGSLRLYVGKDTAEVISYPADNTPLSVNDFLQVQEGKNHYYEPLENIDSGDLFVNKRDNEHRKYLVRVGLFLEEPRDITAVPVSTEEMIVHLNGNEVYAGTTSSNALVHYNFKGGWNELVVLIDGQNATTVNGMTTSLGFNFYALTEDVYSSSQPLKEVDVFDLQNNTKLHDRTVFARRPVEHGIEILTNFAQPGLRFDLFYDYKEDFKEETGLFLRARLSRENGDNVPTPIIRQYRLEFS